MAELFRARRSGVEGFQKIVAIKKILPHIAGDEEFITMFHDEAKLAAQLSHPNIVHIFDLGKIEGGGYFIAMEHVEGRDLRFILNLARETGLNMPVPLAVAVAAKVAAALDYAHRRRGDDGQDLHIVHRDVSPPNILVSTDGDIKLCDFGIAKAASKVSRTESGALKGKVPYMSPEQAWGKPVDQRSDIYSLGAVLFEMATGSKLFQGDSDLNVLEKVRAGDVVLPSSLNPDVPPALDAAVLKALAREPDERYFNASDMLRDLDAVLRTYEPPPSSADLATYVRQVESAELARRVARAREAPPPAAVAPPMKKPAKPEFRISLSQQPTAAASPSAPPPAPPPPPAEPAPQPAPPAKPARSRPRVPVPAGVFAATFPESSADSEKKRRTRLYVLIAAASVVLAVVGWLVVRKPAPSLSSAAAVTALPATPAVVESAVTPVPTPPSVVVLDPKASQEEAQRQLAARRKEQRVAEAAARNLRGMADKAPSPAPVLPSAAPAPTRPSPEVKVAEAALLRRAHGRARRRASAHRASARSRPGGRDRRGGFAGRPRRPRTRRRGAGFRVLSPNRVSCRRSPAGSHRQGRRARARERGRRGIGSEAATGTRVEIRRERGGPRLGPPREVPARDQERDSRQDVAHRRRGRQAVKTVMSREL